MHVYTLGKQKRALFSLAPPVQWQAYPSCSGKYKCHEDAGSAGRQRRDSVHFRPRWTRMLLSSAASGLSLLLTHAMASKTVHPLPKSVRHTMRRLYYWPLDMFDLVTGRRDALTPPRGISPEYVVEHGFREHGEAFFPILVEHGQLRPDGSILDVGCGIGRIAVPLTAYLDKTGSYEGIDVAADAIAWCQRAITTRFPNFHFRVIDVRNARYRPSGSQAASTYQFPFENERFDLVLLKSVFTHMQLDDISNYVHEVARVLKPGGRSVITYFLLDKEAIALAAQGKTKRPFPYDHDVYALQSETEPEMAIAYKEGFIRSLYDKAGLTIVEPVFPGRWRGREKALAAQDVVIAVKQ